MNKRTQRTTWWAVVAFTLLAFSILYSSSLTTKPTQAAPALSSFVSYSGVTGTWNSATCEPLTNASGTTIGYSTRSFTLTSRTLRTWSLIFTLFGDATCQTKLLASRIIGTYSIGDPSRSVPGAKEAFFGFSSKYLTPFTQNLATAFTNAKCGSTPWQVGTEQDISLTGCAAVGLTPVASCIQEYDLLKLDRAKNTLFFGKRPTSGDICAPQRRPTEVGFPLLKQQ